MSKWRIKSKDKKTLLNNETNNELISEFRNFVSQNKDKSYSLCYRILKSREDAEDALQESFLRFYKALKEKKYNGSSKLTTYFYSIVYNTTVEYYRKKKLKTFNIKSIEILEENYKEGDEFKNIDEYKSSINIFKNCPDRNMTKKEISEIINQFLNLIPEHYSTILTMNYINELKIDEISDILNLPVGTVKNRIFRAKEKLKSILLSIFTEEELTDYLNMN